MRAYRPGLDDEAIEQLFAGVPPEELTDLAELLDAMRSHATRQPSPSAELAAVLSDGLTTDKGERPSAAASNGATPAIRGMWLPKWRRRTRMILETALAKLAALGLTAKVGVASAAVAAATTGAGAAGVLPGPVQDAVAQAVAAVTPFELPSNPAGEEGSPSHTAEDTDPPSSVTNDSETTGEDVDAERSTEFGERVSGDATGESDGEPGVDGNATADEASDGRSSDLPTEAEEGRQVADDNRGERGEDAGDASNSDDGRNEAEGNAPDRGDERIPEETPRDGEQERDDAGSAGVEDGSRDSEQERDDAGSAGAEDGSRDGEQGQEAAGSAAEESEGPSAGGRG